MSNSDIGDNKQKSNVVKDIKISCPYENNISSEILFKGAQKANFLNLNNSIKKYNDKTERTNTTIQYIFNQKYLPILSNVIKFKSVNILKKFYEVPFFTQFDLVFLLRGNLNKDEWMNKTQKIRNYPQHLKNTLFYQYKNRLIKNIHEQKFSIVFLYCEKLNRKGIEHFLKNELLEALESFNHSYCLLKWIEFKEVINDNGTYKRPPPTPILDENIIEQKIFFSARDEEGYKSCLIFILEMMAYCYIELRHFSNAIQCFDECIDIDKTNISGIYFGRALARLKNKKITDKEIILANEDINKAINLIEINNITDSDYSYYYLVKEEINKINDNKSDINTKYVKKIISEIISLNNNNEDDFNNRFNSGQKYKILKEIKNKYKFAVKYFSETKNKAQMELTYKEFENFYENYEKFKFFYKFNLDFIKISDIKLTQTEISIICDPKNKEKVKNAKNKICEYIFAHSNYNSGLYQYAVNKICNVENKNKNSKIFGQFEIFKFNIDIVKGKYFVFYLFIFFSLLCLLPITIKFF